MCAIVIILESLDFYVKALIKHSLKLDLRITKDGAYYCQIKHLGCEF